MRAEVCAEKVMFMCWYAAASSASTRSLTTMVLVWVRVRVRVTVGVNPNPNPNPNPKPKPNLARARVARDQDRDGVLEQHVGEVGGLHRLEGGHEDVVEARPLGHLVVRLRAHPLHPVLARPHHVEDGALLGQRPRELEVLRVGRDGLRRAWYGEHGEGALGAGRLA